MQIAFLLYDGFTPLDVIGPYQVLAALPDAVPVFVAEQSGPVRSDSGCQIVADQPITDVQRPDIVVIPGSLSSFTTAAARQPIIDWLQQVSAHATFMASVCTGAVLLAAAGLLNGRQATTHWAARELLARYGIQVSAQRVVDTGQVITAAGVSAGIDMALHIARRTYGDDLTRAVQLAIEYDPAPPLDAGSPGKAGQATTQAVRTALAARGADWLIDPNPHRAA